MSFSRAVVVEHLTPVQEAEERSESEKDMMLATQETAKAKSPKRPTARGDNVVAGITISHPAKILWPATKTSGPGTKLDLARDYEKIARRMLLHIARRRMSMRRAPE